MGGREGGTKETLLLISVDFMEKLGVVVKSGPVSPSPPSRLLTDHEGQKLIYTCNFLTFPLR